MHTWEQPVATPPSVGVGLAVAPSSYLLHRHEPDLDYVALVDPVNERLTVKHLRFADAATFAADVLRAARAHEVGKVLLYASEGQWRELLARGFVLEAVLDGFRHGEPAYLMGYLLQSERWAGWDMEREDAVLESALALALEPPPPLPTGYSLVLCGPELAPALAETYREIFTTFPSPVHDPAFLRQLLAGGEAVFRAVLQAGRVASVAAAELDREFAAAELTDCATRSAYRGQGLMQVLLHALAEDLDRLRVPIRFSLARATSFGMNRALAKAGYAYRGRLRSNTQIMGRHENMHLWVQPLQGGASRLH